MDERNFARFEFEDKFRMDILCCSAASLYQTMTQQNKDETVLNSFAPGRFEWNFRFVIFKRILLIDGSGISCEIALIWMALNFTDDHSTLFQVMAWCRQPVLTQVVAAVWCH